MYANSFKLDGVLFQGPFTKASVLAAKYMKSLPDDVFLCTYPRSGTTWVQNILIALYFGVDKVKSSSAVESIALFPLLELKTPRGKFGSQLANEIPKGQQRLLKNHSPPNLAPIDIFTKKRRTIIVVRNPKDVALSFNEFCQANPQLAKFYHCDGLEEFLALFLEGEVPRSSWWDWTKEWIAKCRANPDSILLIHYEDLHSNYSDTIDKITDFLNLTKRTTEEICELREETNVEKMRAIYEKSAVSFIVNKGENKRWQSEFPTEYIAKFDNMTKKYFENDEIIDKFV